MNSKFKHIEKIEQYIQNNRNDRDLAENILEYILKEVVK